MKWFEILTVMGIMRRHDTMVRPCLLGKDQKNRSHSRRKGPKGKGKAELVRQKGHV